MKYQEIVPQSTTHPNHVSNHRHTRILNDPLESAQANKPTPHQKSHSRSRHATKENTSTVLKFTHAHDSHSLKRPALFLVTPNPLTSVSDPHVPLPKLATFLPSSTIFMPIRALSRESKSLTNRSTLYGWLLCGLGVLGRGRPLTNVRGVVGPAGPEGLRWWLCESLVWRLSVGLGGVSVCLPVDERSLLCPS
jgi:hypothetical protein